MKKERVHSGKSIESIALASSSSDSNQALFKIARQTLSKVYEVEARLDVLEAILLELREKENDSAPPEPKKLIRGINGLAEFLNISNVKAQEIKNSGKLPFFQVDRIVLFESDKVLEAMNKYYGYGKK